MTYWKFVPFLCIGGLSLIFATLYTLLVEDDSTDGEMLGGQTSPYGPPVWVRRSVNGPCILTRHYDYSPVQKDVTGSPVSATVTT